MLYIHKSHVSLGKLNETHKMPPPQCGMGIQDRKLSKILHQMQVITTRLRLFLAKPFKCCCPFHVHEPTRQTFTPKL